MGVLKRPASCARGGAFVSRQRVQSAPSDNSAVPPPAAGKRPAAVEASSSASTSGVRFGCISSYERVKKIGAGAFGIVSKARHLKTDEMVAIKAVRDGGDEEALLREAGLLALCSGNPAVVELREVARCPETNKPHLVMELVGRNLLDVLRKRRSFTESETRRVMTQLLGGADMMHRQGVIHRDLKPGNVLVADDGQVKMCDLGLAKVITKPPPYTQLEGTIWYMAPELLLGEKDYGAPVDVWSLGCVMAELLMGKPLFDEAEEYTQVCRIAKKLGVAASVSGLPFCFDGPSNLREMVPADRLTEAGFQVLHGLLEFEPKKRLTAAAALQMTWFAADS